MEAQLQRLPHGHHHHEEDPHNTVGLHSGIEGGGEEEQHHGEKKSVLKKVKDKARKIKDTIKKHGHGHDDEGGHRRGDIYQQGFEEEEDDDEEEEVDNDPEVHGAPIYESSAVRSSNIPRESITNLEKATDMREDSFNHNARAEGTTQPLVHNTTTLPNVEQPKIKIYPHSPTNSPADHVLPSNYQSKVTDPAGAGGKEAYVGPLAHQLGNLNVGDDEAPGRHVHFDPMQKQFNPESKPGNMELSSKGQDFGNTGGVSMNTIAGKVSSGGDHQEGQDTSSYTRKVSETLAPVYDKVAGTGSAVVSKVYGMVGVENEGGDQGPSMKEYLSEKFRPGDEDKALSEVITNALQKKEPLGEKKLGKVTMSKEVADRLGGAEDSKREGEDAVAAGKESKGQGVVERLTDAVGLWLGKSDGIETAKDSAAQSYVSDAASGSGGGVGEGEGKGVNVGD
ncbi:hypothetical protein ACS0TY_010324 [Phlomoides rotata]